MSGHHKRILMENRTSRAGEGLGSLVLKIAPFAVAAGLGVYGWTSLANDISSQRRAEDTYHKVEAAYSPHETNGRICPQERARFLYRIIKGRACVRNEGELPVYSDGTVVPMEDLAQMALDYALTHPSPKQ
ncbi:MAG TPA: hypothetical protein VMC07_02825 [Candidatus Omnitrophota bacterium]|nr:hypothetical protein [Candidatus Omnitrophota bacterium]